MLQTYGTGCCIPILQRNSTDETKNDFKYMTRKIVHSYLVYLEVL